MTEVLQEKISYKLNIEEQRERLEMLVKENFNLKDKVTEQEDEIKKFKKEVKEKVKQLKENESAREIYEKTK